MSAERARMSAPVSRAASTAAAGLTSTPRSRTSNPFTSSIARTMFLPMSCRSPETVQITILPLLVRKEGSAARCGRRASCTALTTSAASIISGRKSSSRLKRSPISASVGSMQSRKISFGERAASAAPAATSPPRMALSSASKASLTAHLPPCPVDIEAHGGKLIEHTLVEIEPMPKRLEGFDLVELGERLPRRRILVRAFVVPEDLEHQAICSLAGNAQRGVRHLGVEAVLEPARVIRRRSPRGAHAVVVHPRHRAGQGAGSDLPEHLFRPQPGLGVDGGGCEKRRVAGERLAADRVYPEAHAVGV